MTVEIIKIVMADFLHTNTYLTPAVSKPRPVENTPATFIL